MALRDFFRRILRPAATAAPSDPPDRRTREREMLAAWAKAAEAGDLTPPRDIHDANAWDTYWTNSINVGAIDQGFNDMMSSDARLIPMLARRDAVTVLCAGNGLSSEALSVAVHGFQVTALDLSQVPGAAMGGYLRDPEHPLRSIPGFRATEDGVVFEGSGPIPPDLCPKMHRTDACPPRRGGSLRFVSGDLTVPEVCPGPFDAVVERRTVQLFPDEEREHALDRLAARLHERGTFISHMHDGRGGPGRHRPHHALDWAKSRGFVVNYEVDEETRCSAPRLAWLWLTTG